MSIPKLAVAFSCIIATDIWLRRNEHLDDEPRDSVKTSLAATLLWVALLSPLLLSYAS